ncbi:hypothetical protein X753_31225 [Mesorhizobium sp. LNJC399B00]|nr:hypothetical protein X753_31225 [Mesorhizobium sp. LNJC399B00]
MVRQPVGPRVELAIAQPLVLADQRHRLRRFMHLRLEQLMDAPLRRIGRRRPVQLLQQIGPLLGRQQFNPTDRLACIGRHTI